MNDLNRTPEVEQAAREVEQRKLELSRSLKRVEASGGQLAQRLGVQLKPALVGVALAAGALAVVGTVALVARRRRRAGWLSPAQPSAIGALARTVGLGLLRLAARQLAITVAQRIAAAPAETVEPTTGQ